LKERYYYYYYFTILTTTIIIIIINILLLLLSSLLFIHVVGSLRNCATSQEVAVSIPGGIIGIFH